MSTNDFDQTTPLPVGDDETKPLPSFADAPIENQKTSAEANTSTEAEAPDTSAKDEAPAPDTSAAWTGAGEGATPDFTPASEHTFEPQNTPIVPPAHVWSATLGVHHHLHCYRTDCHGFCQGGKPRACGHWNPGDHGCAPHYHRGSQHRDDTQETLATKQNFLDHFDHRGGHFRAEYARLFSSVQGA